MWLKHEVWDEYFNVISAHQESDYSVFLLNYYEVDDLIDWNKYNIVYLLFTVTVLLFHLCLSLRHLLDSRQCVGGDGEGGGVGAGGNMAQCPRLQATGAQRAVIH